MSFLNILRNDFENLSRMFPGNLSLNVKGMNVLFPFFLGGGLLIVDEPDDSDVKSLKAGDSPGTSREGDEVVCHVGKLLISQHSVSGV